MNKVINMDRGQYTIIDDRPCDWPEEDWPEATVSHKFNRARKGVR